MGNYIATGCDYIRGKKEIETPQFKCRSCHNCQNNWCNFFDRHVIPTLNKCFNHTMYHPTSMIYQTPEEIRQLSKIEDKQVA